MFGFLKVNEVAKRFNFDRHIEEKKKKRLFDIIFLSISFILLNLILYLITKI
jgi:predicted rRNA methylase YqxC with S4 and FtsJ domains